MIIKATAKEMEYIKDIVQTTIGTVYPLYYPLGAVCFFKKHHNDQKIMADINKGIVYLLQEENEYVGTVTVKENEICRLFVLPKYQHKGYGKALLDFSEAMIKKQYSKISLDASFPAKKFYLKRGYIEVGFYQIQTEHGDMLCYDVMEKVVS